MRMIESVVLFLLLYPAWAALGQQSDGWEPFKELKEQKRQEQSGQMLTNDSIVKLVKVGFSDETITSMIEHQAGNYALGADDIIALKKAGVSEKVITAMSSKMTSVLIAAPNGPAGTVEKKEPNQPQSPETPVARVFITDSQSWEIAGSSAGGWSRQGGGWGSVMGGGARPQTAEIIKTFNQRCPSLIVTRNAATADYAIVLDHEGGKKFYRRDNKVAVFNRNGDVIFSRSVRILGNAVEEACNAILRYSPSLSSSVPSAATQAGPNPTKASEPRTNEIRLGMTPAEVEVILGEPQTRVNLGPKLLYKYKDMTVEFHEGKVTDVR